MQTKKNIFDGLSLVVLTLFFISIPLNAMEERKSREDVGEEKQSLVQMQSSKQREYVLITDIGGDIDDALTLKLAFELQCPPKAIIATHHRPLEKAMIAKCIATHSGYKDVPVFVGDGCTQQDSRDSFQKKNSLWPSFFGYLNPKQNERLWNPTQAKAYAETFGQEFDVMSKEVDVTMSASEMLIQMVQGSKKGEKVDIVALAPLHDLHAAITKIREKDGDDAAYAFTQKIRLWSMGGNYPFGYNWLVSPETAALVLKDVETICISSEFIRTLELNVTTQEFDEFSKSPNNKLAQAIMQDWRNWNKDDQLKNDKNLCDPVTLYLYLHPEEITELEGVAVVFPCLDDQGHLKKEFQGSAYCTKGLENQLITLESNAKSNVTFVQKVRDAQQLRTDIITVLKKALIQTKDSKL